MNLAELSEQIQIEQNNLSLTNIEIQNLIKIVESKNPISPTTHERAAFASYTTSLYNGIENILKRICKYKSISVPKGESSHSELLSLFSEPSEMGIPLLFSEELYDEIDELRRFRHFAFHNYSIQVKWERIKPILYKIDLTLKSFDESVNQFLSKEISE